MKKNKLLYPLLIAFSFLFFIIFTNSCSTQRSPVKQVKTTTYRNYRETEPKRTTTRQTSTRHYIKKQKSKKQNY